MYNRLIIQDCSTKDNTKNRNTMAGPATLKNLGAKLLLSAILGGKQCGVPKVPFWGLFGKKNCWIIQDLSAPFHESTHVFIRQFGFFRIWEKITQNASGWSQSSCHFNPIQPEWFLMRFSFSELFFLNLHSAKFPTCILENFGTCTLQNLSKSPQ